MIEELEKLIKIKKKHFIKKMWGIIDELGWGIKNYDYKLMAKYLDENYSDIVIKQFELFVIFQRNEIIKTLEDYAELKIGNRHGYYGVGDDGFWDLTAHIVGLGKYWFNRITDDPEIAKEMCDNMMNKENFQYIFNHTEIGKKEREARRIKLSSTPLNKKYSEVPSK